MMEDRLGVWSSIYNVKDGLGDKTQIVFIRRRSACGGTGLY